MLHRVMGKVRQLTAFWGSLLLILAAVGPFEHDHHAVEVVGSYTCSIDHLDEHGAEAQPHSESQSRHLEAAGTPHQHVCVGCQSKTRRSDLNPRLASISSLEPASGETSILDGLLRTAQSSPQPPLRGPPLA